MASQSDTEMEIEIEDTDQSQQECEAQKHLPRYPGEVVSARQIVEKEERDANDLSIIQIEPAENTQTSKASATSIRGDATRVTIQYNSC